MNELRARAAKFASDWQEARYERSETQTFYNEFFEIFGVHRRRVATFEQPVKMLGERRGFIDLFWKGVLLVEQKSAGRDLRRARLQALDYFPNLKPEEIPRYLLVSDFQNFELYDFDEGGEVRSFKLRELPNHVDAFLFIMGAQRVVFKDEDPVNIEAAAKIAKIHDGLASAGYVGHDLEQFLVRLVFCLFADDTGIFDERDAFLDRIENWTSPDGSDVGAKVTELFELLNTPLQKRLTNLDSDLARFPYVNGELFRERLRIPAFDGPLRAALIEACRFDWSKVSPAIFGSLFQAVMNPRERREQGAHYTTEKNILKVIGPLFLDELRAEFDACLAKRGAARTNALDSFHEKLGKLTFFDPACGCGNFLIIAYREVRSIEIELLRARYPGGQLELDVDRVARINVDQFHGIEINEFPARIAETALWMMDHLMNVELSRFLGKSYTRIPLQRSPHIHHGDALEIDWSKIIKPERCDYILGNPPFAGSKYQSPKQRQQVQRIAKIRGSGGTLDYVCAWFLKAGEFMQEGGKTQVAFVATNSITQGEQVAQLWPILFHQYGLEIGFAHRTFEWGSEAPGKAHVHVVIIGLARRENEPPKKRLFTYGSPRGEPSESQHDSLTPYLTSGEMLKDRHVVVRETPRSLSPGVPEMVIGSKPIDDGNYIFDAQGRGEFLKEEPGARKFLHPYVGAEEFINGRKRWILWLGDAGPPELRRLPAVLRRIDAVRRFREQSKSEPTRAIAATPTLFHINVIPPRPFLLIPRVSSEQRPYVPIGWIRPPTIPSDATVLLPDATPFHFGVLTSRMHMAWLRQIGGRLESRYRYSIGVVYNTFPWPTASDSQRKKIMALAKGVLDARAHFPKATMADLYDPAAMPPPLRKAHDRLDVAVEALYRPAPFHSDHERVEFLLRLYEGLALPLIRPKPSRKGSRRKS